MMTAAPYFARRPVGVAAALIALALAGPAAAQTKPATPAAPAKPAAPAQAAPAGGAPAAPGADAQAPEMRIASTPWTKICQEIPEAKKQACVVSQTVMLENQQPLVRLDITEFQGEPKKGLRVILPAGMRLQPGIRLTIDQQPTAIPYSICIPAQAGAICAAEVEVDAELVNKLKKAKQVVIQAINGAGRPFNVPMNMKDFQKVMDGPGQDAKVLMEQERQRIEAERQREDQARAALEKKAQEMNKSGTAPAQGK